jgi:hypothetical protein
VVVDDRGDLAGAEVADPVPDLDLRGLQQVVEGVEGGGGRRGGGVAHPGDVTCG